MNDSVISVLHDIGKRCRDSEAGYRTAAENAQDFDLKSQFQRLAEERAEMADEIDRLLRQHGADPAPASGTNLGAAHRMFTDLKAALVGNNRQAVVAEVARGESAAEASYDKALRADLPIEVRSVLLRQHDRVRETRDRYRAMAGSRPGVGDQLSGLGGRVSEAGQRSAAAVNQYVSKQPMRSSMMAFGMGFLLGALVVSASMGYRNHR